MERKITKPESGTVGKAPASPQVRPQARMLDSEIIQANAAARARLSPEEQKRLDRRLDSMISAPNRFVSSVHQSFKMWLNHAALMKGARVEYAYSNFMYKREVERLLKAGADPNLMKCFGRTLLMSLASRGCDIYIDVMLESQHLSSYERARIPSKLPATGATKIAELLIAYGADATAKDDHGRTALSLADNAEFVEFLKAAGATE